MGEELVYLDNAASSWPKPEPVVRAVERMVREVGANPGRSGHRLSVEAARAITEARCAMAGLLGASNPLRVVFTKNATEALNMAIRGLLRPGDRVVVSSMEHNSVMRPLMAERGRGVEVEVVRCSPEGRLDPDDVKRALKRRTRLVIHVHASNVSGCVTPAAEIGRIAREHGAFYCVDAAQSAGCLPIDVERMNVDLLAFTGHKSLYGPQGTGGLYVAEGVDAHLQPLMAGGTGSLSEREEQPAFMPDRYESGTPNTPGIAGLLEGVTFVASLGVDTIRRHETSLAALLMDALSEIPGVRVVGPTDRESRVAIVSIVVAGMDPGEIAYRLDEDHGVLCRPGLHCAPSAHATLATFPAGTLRFSIGYFNTEEHIHRAVSALKSIVAKGG
ncbi:MAG TPA: aminotransferase class V-fold PLP-dependent enzyme [Deltaproteobacteria bacterium]|nr:aminotransferase class V-fold PLP-dependent enzyme [Deltaproteobacteria bacterium]HOM29162.1 aminotransferase class V-fold PLP-dependent enzyme [Deltaproteobacteria bacterium]HPP80839.1 aminotransferase class V-fold PLP-dependent enzyme [Deltaproteobacteria bacterium]